MNHTALSGRRRTLASCLALCAALASLRAGSPGEAACARFDFAQQMAQATVEAETTFLDVGTREARGHLLTGWSIDELWHDKTSFAWAMGQAATVRFTRFSAEPFTLYFRCRPIDIAGAPPQEVTVRVNGMEVSQVKLEADFHNYEVAVPASAVHVGDNQMQLRFGYFRLPPPAPPGVRGAPELRRLAVAWDWIGFGARSAPAKPEPQAAPAARALSLPFLTRVDFYLQVQPGSSLRWQAVQPWRTTRLGRDAALDVQIDWDGQPASRPRRFTAGSFAKPAVVPLTNRTPAFARVSFLARPGGTANAVAAGLTLAAPEVVPAGCAEEDGAPAAATRPAPASGPNVVLYMIDTLRADHLGVYGYRRPVSPEIDAFAARATVFDRAFAQSGWTKSSVASMLTGLRVVGHGVAERMDTLPDAVRTLPEMLHEAGYATFGVSTNPAVSAAAGLARGYDRFVELFAEEEASPAQFVAQPAERVNAELFRWLGDRAGSDGGEGAGAEGGGGRERARPFFAYLHAMEAHEPYQPPEAFRLRFAGQADAALCRPGPREVTAALAGRPGLTRTALSDNFAALYDAQIAHADSQFGVLVRRLRELGLYDNTVIILVADHGEEFLDHGLFAHGHSLYQEILHVPLIVHWPGERHAGRRVGAPAQHIDLLPTVLAAAGVRVPAALPGLDLRQLAQVEPPIEREVASDLSLAGTRIASLISGGMHLVVRERPNPDAELYDLRQDPRELHNLANPEGPQGVRLGFLMTRLRTLHRGWSGAVEVAGAAPGWPAPLAELDRQLRSLGYV